ncbi:unnamed protein product [Caenorhabditis sp. 36 PRJEB53466]|nr:unnamed protein product [Caenorhabditis sp. 36 PRJEB53466]
MSTVGYSLVKSNITFYSPVMSRLRSDTYIKPGSESSFDSDDLHSRRYGHQLENYCCFSDVSAKKAVILSGIITGTQAVGNFAFLLHGCGITMFDMGLALIPVVLGTGAVLFITFAFLHHSSCSLKPYIVHHVQLAVLYFLCLVLFAAVTCKQQLSLDILSFLSNHSSNFAHIQSAEGPQKLIVGGYLLSQLVISFFCLHLSGSLFTWLDTEKRYISNECTEVI